MEPLNRDTIKAYLIQKKIFPENALLNVIDLHEEIQNIEGYVNLIFAVRDLNTNCSVVVKQLLPYIRAFKEADGGDHPVLMERLQCSPLWEPSTRISLRTSIFLTRPRASLSWRILWIWSCCASS